MKKSFVLLSCFVTANAFAANVDYWYDVNNACSVRWCRSQPSTGQCCAPENAATTLPTATRSGYTLRGWTTSSVLDADETAGSLANLVATKDASLSDISVNGATTLRTAWAENCASNITGGTCNLTIDDNGSVTYTTTPNNGYTCDSGCNTSNPVFESQSADVPEDWITFTLDDNGGSGSEPTTFACQRNTNTRTDCARGCYKTEGNCSTSNKFTGLTTKPTRGTSSYISYDGHFSGTRQILTDTGALNGTNWANVSGKNATITAQWTENKIQIDYDKGNCQSANQSTSKLSCNVNGTLTLSDATPNNGQKFDNWSVNGHGFTNSISCDRNTLGGSIGEVVTITAQCSATTPEQPGTVNLTYITSCSNSSGCPNVPATNPQTCTPGQTVTLTRPSVSDGWTFGGWMVNGNVYTAGQSFTCPSSDTQIMVMFNSESVSSWRVIQLDDNGAETQSNPKYLCCDANGVKTGWYGGTTSNACTSMLSRATQLTKPTKSGYDYDGHELDDGTVVVDSNGVIKTSVSCASLSSNQTATAQFSPTVSEPETVTINYDFTCGDDTDNCASSQTSPSTCEAGRYFYLYKPTPTSGYEFVGFRVNNVWTPIMNEVPGLDSSWQTCESSGMYVEVVMRPTAPVVNDVTLTYTTNCAGRSDCPTLPTTTPTCTPGEPIDLPTVSGGNSSWQFSNFCIDTTCGNTLTCPESDATITVNFTQTSNWVSISLNDNGAETQSNPKYLCCDANGVKSGWYGATSEAGCANAAKITELQDIPSKSGYEYYGHQVIGDNYLVESDGTINTSLSCASLSNVQAVVADWRSEAKGPYIQMLLKDDIIY